MVALFIQPAVELRCITDECPRHEVATIKRQRPVHVAAVERCRERSRVAPEHRVIDADVILAATDDHAVAKRVAEMVERLTEGVARRRVIRLRPEDREQHLAPVKSWRSREGEVGEEGETLRLGEDRVQIAASVVAEVDRTQNP
jgi:hypothetical protein